jgi:dolichol-phosphate mannosyltransferase
MRPLVIVPTYNERENLPQLTEALLAIPDLRVLVVDDASPDGTGMVAEQLAGSSDGRMTVLRRTGKRGLGVAYIDGMQLALRTDADVICQMDADLSHQPIDLVRMLQAIQHADVVIGSRYVPGGRIVNWPPHRKALSATANRYIRALCSVSAHDCTSGFRCWRRHALAGIPLDRIRSEGYAFLVEMLCEAVRQRCVIAEVPISFIERRHGASKLRARIILESALLPWRIAFDPARRAPADSTTSAGNAAALSQDGPVNVHVSDFHHGRSDAI